MSEDKTVTAVDEIEEQKIVNPEYPFGTENPSKEDLDNLKESHGKIFVTMLGNHMYYFIRKLTRREYRDVRKMQNAMGGITEQLNALQAQPPTDESAKLAEDLSDRLEDLTMGLEDHITNVCLAYPEVTEDDLAKGDAGVPTVLSELILGISGFTTMMNPVPITLD